MTSKFALAPSASERALEQRLDADHIAGRRDRQRELVLHGAAARLVHAHRDVRLQRMRGRGQLVEIDLELGVARIVGRRQIVERLLCRIDLVVGEPELIAGKSGALFRGRDRHVAVEIEIGGRRAVEEAAGDIHFGGRVLRQMIRLRLQIELDPVGHVILDQKCGFADRRQLRIGEGAHMPGAGRRAGIDRQRQRVAAETLVGNLRALELDAVGPLDDERQRRIERGRALRVAQKRGEITPSRRSDRRRARHRRRRRARSAPACRTRRDRSGRRPTIAD